MCFFFRYPILPMCGIRLVQRCAAWISFHWFGLQKPGRCRRSGTRSKRTRNRVFTEEGPSALSLLEANIASGTSLREVKFKRHHYERPEHANGARTETIFHFLVHHFSCSRLIPRVRTDSFDTTYACIMQSMR